ncbi:ExeM/NucH family extracellular endonuclease [Marinobacter salinexigens]|uniref:ExeM/NucH family extracellular endonuclease n=1 Tax=Marinobacter salinexigens TaxID=2919747 RepID=A0A5B0VJH9_9GAMM|nr:ExeM/NucH family extracellular endonuclease [Marinobacter salinexigens]KAA1174433.1 ExeM/NucH family extracellular endonuclease [Marinobacter salinexigens]
MTMKRSLLAAAIGGLLTTTAQASLVISEYIEGSSNNKAIELLNTGDQTVDLTAWELQVFFNGSSTAGLTVDLEGAVEPGSNFVFSHSSAAAEILAVANQTTGAGLFNGDDAVVLLNGGNVADSIGQVGFDPGSYWGSGDITTQNHTLRRVEGSSADTDPYDAYDPATSFSGFAQDSFDDLGAAGNPDGGSGDNGGENPEAPNMSCGAEATLISSIQGPTDISPLEGQNVVVEAVVTAAFSGLNGFYIQEEASDQDDNSQTSEGLFVYDRDLSVVPGQVVRLAGTVTEYYNLTELTSISDSAICGTSELPAVSTVTLPWSSPEAPEAFESMRVRFAEGLTVNDNYDLGRYGSLTLGSGRHFVPTSIVSPGTDATLVDEMNTLDRIILDDASTLQNPDVIPYPGPQLSASQTVRSGDTVHDLEGILDYSYSEWRLQPTSAPSFSQSNPRTFEPALEDRGNLVVASFNVLNFFNGDGLGGGFPTSRGATTPEELSRQTDKLVSAISALNADVVGLMEIENDGYDENSAIAELASALGGNWGYVNPGLEQLGSDEIAVGFIYRTDRVETVGNAATLNGVPFDDLNRQPLAQTFRLLDSQDGVTIAVNHFKSKGCYDVEGPDADQGDGQSCWNPTRTAAAEALSAWLTSDATGTGEQDVLIIGDLNSYAKEDPITALTTNGFTNLIAGFEGEQAYSYVYYGQAGYLDHGLANNALLSKVKDATVWAINADEPRALDYNTEYKSPEQQASLYAPDAYRASDHDPVIVALEMDVRTASERADLNGDGRITGRDLSRFVLALLFGRATAPDYDINGDGSIDRNDMFALINAMRGH